MKEINIHEATPSQLDWLIESLSHGVVSMTATHVHREGFKPNDFPVRKFTTTPSIFWPVVSRYVSDPEPYRIYDGLFGWRCYVPHHGWFRGETGIVAAARGYLRGVTGMDKHLVPEELQ